MYQVLGTVYCVSRCTKYCYPSVLCTMYLSVPSTVYWVLCIGYCVLYTVYCVLGTGYCVLGTGYCVLVTGYCVLGTVYLVLGTGYCVLGTVSCVLVYLIKCTRYCVKLKGEVNILL